MEARLFQLKLLWCLRTCFGERVTDARLSDPRFVDLDAQMFNSLGFSCKNTAEGDEFGFEMSPVKAKELTIIYLPNIDSEVIPSALASIDKGTRAGKQFVLIVNNLSSILERFEDRRVLTPELALMYRLNCRSASINSVELAHDAKDFRGFEVYAYELNPSE